MNFTLMQLNKLTEISQFRTKSNLMIHVVPNKQMIGEYFVMKQKTEDRRQKRIDVKNE